MKSVCLGVLLFVAAPLFSQSPSDPRMEGGQFLWFHLTETPNQVRTVLGEPRLVSAFGEDFISWQYQIGVEDLHDYSHQLVFRRSTGKLISVTQNFEPPRMVKDLFDGAVTRVGPNKFPVLMKRISDDAYLLAPGAMDAASPLSQVLLISPAELHALYPWLD